MEWKILGEVKEGKVDSEELCLRLYTIYFNQIFIFMDDSRSNKAQVLFTANYYDAFECLETCPKYNRARASLFSDETEMSKLLTFVANTTTDPVTETFYKDITASQIWLGMR